MKKIRHSLSVSTLVLGTLLTSFAALPLVAQDWPMFGQNLSNTANSSQTDISTKNVYKLRPKWTFTTGGDVSARAAVVNGVAYFPDWAGNVYAVNAPNGRVVWSHQLSDYVGGAQGSTHARATPTIAGGTLYLGTQEGAWLLAINASNGALRWKTQLESPAIDPVALITTAASVYGGSVYVGVASNQEALAAFLPGFVCCTARGSVVSLNASTGAIQWKTYTVPTGYSGGGVWGSNPVVDASRNTVFIGTGNNYSKPTDPAYLSCVSGGGSESSCLSPDDHVDSILALDMGTGTIKWAKRLVTWTQFGVTDGSDDWNVACFIPPFTNCPPAPTGPDYDFGSAPNEITYQTQHGSKTIIGAGQKSGIYYALDPDSGAQLWHTQVGPGSSLGGMEWGSASDGNRIYVAIANYYGIPYQTGSAGSWAALDPATGNILWQKADPNGSIDLGSVAVANGVVYAASMSGTANASTMFALDAASGNILWNFAAGSSVISGATIVQDTVYWGSGYAHLGIPGYTGNNKFFAFTPNGN
jgi:polyvinyl alcohol dehydrogenase (cytochrome)